MRAVCDGITRVIHVPVNFLNSAGLFHCPRTAARPGHHRRDGRRRAINERPPLLRFASRDNSGHYRGDRRPLRFEINMSARNGSKLWVRRAVGADEARHVGARLPRPHEIRHSGLAPDERNNMLSPARTEGPHDLRRYQA
jgi:hypothetical protein